MTEYDDDMEREGCLTFEEARKILGVSTRTLRRLTISGEIASYRVGRRPLNPNRDRRPLRILPTEIDRYRERNQAVKQAHGGTSLDKVSSGAWGR